MQIKIEVDGLKELEKQILKLGAIEGKKVLRKSAMFATNPVVKEMKAKAPVAAGVIKRKVRGKEFEIEPGTLRKNIKRRNIFGKDGFTYQQLIYVSRKAFWGSFFEFGTSKITAKPFMRPAFDNGKHLIIQRFKDKMRQNIDKAVAKK